MTVWSPWVTGDWPRYAKHEDARCFNCRGSLNPRPRLADQPPGKGHWQSHCARCSMFTWYDLEPT